MENRVRITIGDWSQDGHNQYDEFVFQSNKTVSEIRQAYKDSCKLTGLQFNENEDYTGLNLTWDHPETNKRKICVEYGKATTGSKENMEKYPNGVQEWLSDELIKARESFNINFNIGIELSESGWIKAKEIYIADITELFKHNKEWLEQYISDVDTHFKNHTKEIDGKTYFVDQMWEIMSRYGALFFNGSNYLNATNIILWRD